MGAASNVLLKNDDEILPLDLDRLKSIAIIGSDAGPHSGLKNASGRELEVISSLDDWDLKKAAESSSTVDCAIVFFSTNSGEEHVVFENNFGDRNNISLWQNRDM